METVFDLEDSGSQPVSPTLEGRVEAVVVEVEDHEFKASLGYIVYFRIPKSLSETILLKRDKQTGL